MLVFVDQYPVSNMLVCHALMVLGDLKSSNLTERKMQTSIGHEGLEVPVTWFLLYGRAHLAAVISQDINKLPSTPA